MKIIRKPAYEDKDRLLLHSAGDLKYFTSPLMDEVSGVKHLFSTRLGGVSKGDTGSMNLSFPREENKDNVLENYRRLGEAAGFDPSKIVMTHQTHTNHVRIVTEEDEGSGITRERPYRDIDALVTDCPDIPLVCFSADCVPLLIADPVRRVIGCAHSGWKGTAADIGGEVIRAMQRFFGTDPDDVTAAIGPSICQDCYEVGEEVIEEFAGKYPASSHAALFYRKENGKDQLNLWEACRFNFLEAGVSPGRISLPDVCTHCNPSLLFSHRTLHGRQGNLGAFIMLSH